jgi:hypothetical protein
MRITLSTRNASAVIANIVAADARAQRAVKGAVKRAGNAVHGLTRENMLSMGIFDTGHMYDVLRLRYSEAGLSFQVGWDEADFPKSFYPIFVVFGTIKMPGRDPLFPAHARVKPIFRQDIADSVRAALARRGAIS